MLLSTKDFPSRRTELKKPLAVEGDGILFCEKDKFLVANEKGGFRTQRSLCGEKKSVAKRKREISDLITSKTFLEVIPSSRNVAKFSFSKSLLKEDLSSRCL